MTEDADESTGPTYDIQLNDLSLHKLSLLIGAISHFGLFVSANGKAGDGARLLELQKELMEENPDAMGEAMIEADYIRVQQLPEDLREKLGVEVGPDGSVVDAGDFEDIDVE